MAHVSINGDDLVVEIEGMDKLWSLKSRLVIPLANVRGATADPGIAAGPIVLAIADLCTLLFYFNLARWVL